MKKLNDPVFHALFPGGKQFMARRLLSEKLNPWRKSHDIEMAALVAFGVLPHIKTIPAMGMMIEDYEAGLYEGVHTLVVPSSGNTAHAVARLAPAFGISVVKALVQSDVPDSKKGILSALSVVDLIEVGGKRSVAERALKEASMDGHHHLDQYTHRGNDRFLERFVGPQILSVVGRNLAIVAIAMGSGGTACGVARYLERERPHSKVLGVRPKLGHRVPGCRDEKKMAEVSTLPVWDYVHDVAEVERETSFIGMKMLWSEVEPQPGPSSGMAFQGLVKYLSELEKSDLDRLRGKTVAFICPDDGRFYSERSGGTLDPDQGAVA